MTRTVTVTVPLPEPTPVIELSLNAPPGGLGDLLPGVDRDYTMSVSAIATATGLPGPITLSVADPSTNATGHLVNGDYSLIDPLQARAFSASATGGPFTPLRADRGPLTLLTYGGPISGDVGTIEFKQPVRVADPLRAGVYSKTLTFTLAVGGP